MKIIFAQGNHDSKYDHTRHNVGFLAIDSFGESLGANWSQKSKFRAFIAEVSLGGEKIILVKPMTYYNDTGISARKLIDFYDLDSATDFLVVHDDLALPLGTIRTRAQGSDAGNNGIKSINSHLGPEYHRVRIGIATDLRDRMQDADFVLSRFTKAETDQLRADIIPHVMQCIEQFCKNTLQANSHTVEKQ